MKKKFNILLLPDANFKWFWKPFVKAIKFLSKGKLNIYSRTSGLSSYLTDGEDKSRFDILTYDIYDLIIKEKMNHDVNFQRLKEIEKLYKINLIKEIIFNDRQLGKNFYFSALNHHETKISEKCDFNVQLNACIASFDYWERILTEKNVNLILSYISGWGLHIRPLFIIAKKRKILIRNIFPARIKNLFFWSTNEYGSLGKKLLKSLESKLNIKGSKKNLDAKKLKNILSSDKVEQKTKQSYTLLGSIRLILYRCLKMIYMSYKDKTKFSQTVKLMEGIKYEFNGYYNQRYLNFFSEKKISEQKLNNSIFLPLQQVPESSTIGLSFLHDQLNFVLEVALRLPPNYRLVVKEHLYAIAARKISFYKSIMGLKNVILAHNYIPGSVLLKNCYGLITLSSSAAYEAAILGKPCLTFEKFPHIKNLKHVMHCKNLEDLKGLSDFLEFYSIEKNRLLAKQDGSLYLRNCEKTFFPIFGDELASRKKIIDNNNLNIIIKELRKSLA